MADDAAESVEVAGGRVLSPPLDARVGRAAVVADPFDDVPVPVDLSKGRYATDEHGTVTASRLSGCASHVGLDLGILDVGQEAQVPAAYVRVIDLDVERLEQQHHIRVIGEGDGLERCDYRSPSFNVECRLVYDESGLVPDHPGIATRVL